MAICNRAVWAVAQLGWEWDQHMCTHVLSSICINWTRCVHTGPLLAQPCSPLPPPLLGHQASKVGVNGRVWLMCRSLAVPWWLNVLQPGPLLSSSRWTYFSYGGIPGWGRLCISWKWSLNFFKCNILVFIRQYMGSSTLKPQHSVQGFVGLVHISCIILNHLWFAICSNWVHTILSQNEPW